MWVEIEPGKGSTFHFVAIFGRMSAPASEPGRVSPKALDGIRVLVVDDNATNRQILEEMLASWHMRPELAADAKSAMAALHRAADARDRFDAVIADGQMPVTDGFMLTRRIRQDKKLAGTRIVMLTSIGLGEGSARAAKAGVDAYLTKPVKHSDLLDALASVLGASTRRRRTGRATPRVSRRPRRALRILVAEDNPVNRKLVMTLLRKRRHKVTGVENGRLAIEAIRKDNGRFDVVLMDLQMPEMGGLEATASIRASEAGTGRHLPIIALTAHAMQGDRERCLAAGMDGYLSKPIDVAELISAVEHSGDTRAAVRPESPAAASSPIFDEKAALAVVGQDRSLLEEVVATFRASRVAYEERIESALGRNDREALRMSAHALKGALATVGSPAGREAAARLEQCAGDESLDHARSAYSSLKACFVRLDRAFVSARLTPRRKVARRKPRRAVRKRGRR